MRDGRRPQRLLHAVLDVFLPEILAVDQFDGEPQAAMPRMIVRLKNADAVASRRAERMKKWLGLAAIDLFPERQVACLIKKRNRLPQIMHNAHESILPRSRYASYPLALDTGRGSG